MSKVFERVYFEPILSQYVFPVIYGNTCTSDVFRGYMEVEHWLRIGQLSLHSWNRNSGYLRILLVNVFIFYPLRSTRNLWGVKWQHWLEMVWMFRSKFHSFPSIYFLWVFICHIWSKHIQQLTKAFLFQVKFVLNLFFIVTIPF